MSHEDMFWGINNGLQNYQKIKAKKIFIQQCDYRGLFFLMKSSVLQTKFVITCVFCQIFKDILMFHFLVNTKLKCHPSSFFCTKGHVQL